MKTMIQEFGPSCLITDINRTRIAPELCLNRGNISKKHQNFALTEEVSNESGINEESQENDGIQLRYNSMARSFCVGILYVSCFRLLMLLVVFNRRVCLFYSLICIIVNLIGVYRWLVYCVQEKAKLRMMKQKGSANAESYWDNMWGRPKEYQNTEEEVKERARRAAAAARRWREYSRRGADKAPTFKLPEAVSNKEN